MSKWIKTALCIVLAVAAITVTESVLDIFKSSDYALGSLLFDRVEILDATGVPRDVDPALAPWDLEAGESLRLSKRLPELQDGPEIYDNRFLSFYTGGAEYVFLIDGEEVLRKSDPLEKMNAYSPESRMSLLPEWAGAELTVLLRPTGPDAVPLPQEGVGAGDEDDARPVVPAAQLVGELHAVHAVHTYVKAEHIEALSPGVQRLKELSRRGEGDDFVLHAQRIQTLAAKPAQLPQGFRLIVADG